MKVLLVLFLFSFSFALRGLYQVYPERRDPSVLERQNQEQRQNQGPYPYPLEFINVLYDIYVGGENRVDTKNTESYVYKTWLFENTLAFIGYFHRTFWESGVSGQASGGSFQNYKEQLALIRGVLHKGRISDADLDQQNVLREERLRDYYKAIYVGVLAGTSYGLIPFPSVDQSGKYGKVLSPAFAFRVGQQQLRHAVLTEYAVRLAQRRAELAVMWHYVKNFCTVDLPSRMQAGQSEEFESPELSGPCCAAIVSAIMDLKAGVVSALRVLAAQNQVLGELQCTVLLSILHNAKVELEAAEINLYQLSVQYGLLSNQERDKVGIK